MKNHETSCLEDENQVVREIKQLKSIRKQLALNVGFQDETLQALYQKDQIQEHVKVHISSLNFYSTFILSCIYLTILSVMDVD